MPTDFEDRLRDALRTRADDVRPDPATWDRVRERVRRRRRVGWVYTAAGVAAATVLIVVAVIALPTLLDEDGGRVELADEVPSAPQPAPTSQPPDNESPPGLAAGDRGFVATDGERIMLLDASGGEAATLSNPRAGGGGGEEATGFRSVAVRPGSTATDLTVVWRRGIDCGAGLGWERFVDGEPAGGGDLPFTDCPGTPAFSPDGRHLAWVEGDAGDPTTFSLQTIDWTDGGPGHRDASFRLDVPEAVPAARTGPSGLHLLDLSDWIWPTQAGVEAGGYLTLRANTAQQEPRTCTLPVERQSDGALAFPDSGVLTCHEGIADAGGHGADGPAIALYGLRIGAAGVELTRATDGESDATAVPDSDAPPVRWWLAAWGETVVAGDGEGRAWTVRYDDGWGSFARLPGRILMAQPLKPLDPAAAPTECDGSPSQPVACSHPPGEFAQLPAPVTNTALALYDAAVARDWEQLAASLPDDGQFTSTFGGGDDHIGHYQRLQASGEDVFGTLQAVLSLPSAEQDGMYVWPFAHVRSPDSLSSAELEQLETVFGRDQVAGWMEAGSYLGWRVGIDADGTWRYFVAGD